MYITKKIKIVHKKEFALVALNIENKILVIYMVIINMKIININTFWVTQIRLLKADKTFINNFTKYSHYTDIFSSKFVAELSKHTNINNYIIELKKVNTYFMA